MWPGPGQHSGCRTGRRTTPATPRPGPSSGPSRPRYSRTPAPQKQGARDPCRALPRTPDSPPARPDTPPSTQPAPYPQVGDPPQTPPGGRRDPDNPLWGIPCGRGRENTPHSPPPQRHQPGTPHPHRTPATPDSVRRPGHRPGPRPASDPTAGRRTRVDRPDHRSPVQRRPTTDGAGAAGSTGSPCARPCASG
jgi:hypothetical protein